MQFYDINIQPSGPQALRQIDAPGSFVYFYKGSAGGADPTITLRGVSTGLRLLLAPGQGYRLPEGAQEETSWVIGNYASVGTIAGTLLIGRGDVTDNRTSGQVEVIDGEQARVLAGISFVGSVAITGVAGQNAYCQLWNPAGSGRNLVVGNLSFASSTAVGIYVFFKNAALANAGPVVTNKKADILTTGVAKLQSETAVAAPASAMWSGFLSGGVVTPWQPKGGLVVPPGWGIVAGVNTNAAPLYMNAEYFEAGLG